MRASYMAVCLFLALFLVGCGGGESETGSAESSSAATRPVLELTTADEEESTGVASEPAALATGCEPTQPDMLGPYYMPDAPVRTSVDTGYMMSGRVLSADGCEPIPGAQLEFWLADSQGVYDDAHRATVLAGEGGEYRFQSNFPGPYENRPPHIHVRVTAPGHGELVTQHYPEAGQTEAIFDLVLVPA